MEDRPPDDSMPRLRHRRPALAVGLRLTREDARIYFELFLRVRERTGFARIARHRANRRADVEQLGNKAELR
jgi:hypothetical protein